MNAASRLVYFCQHCQHVEWSLSLLMYMTQNTVREITLLNALVLCQPKVSRWMETTTSCINIPVEVIGADIHPVVMIETLNLSW